jgi:arylsulfatase A-like enzyme
MPARPNLLIVHCHDLGQHLGCYGVPTVRTPHLDAFAAEGVRFSRSYATSPSCSPSRASLVTGRYPHNNGVMGLCHSHFAWDLYDDEVHLAQYLNAAGYATAAVGVIHETAKGAGRCGYQEYRAPAMAKEAADEAVALLPKLAAGERPFYLWVGFVEPHRLPMPDGIPGDNGFPGEHLQPDDSLGVHVPPHLADTPGTRRELAGLQGAIRHVDDQFDRILAALENSGAADDTLVIFTTDHGIAMPRAKCSLYEPGVSIACLMRFRSRPVWNGGQVRSELVSNLDVLPTLLELAGVEAPARLQGSSLAPLLDGRPYAARQALFTEMTCHDYYDPRRSVRTERYKLIANFSSAPAFMDPSQRWRPLADTVEPPNHAVAYHPPVELFDLAEDPWEQRDLADRPETAAIQRELLALLAEHLRQTADPILDGAITSPIHRTALRRLAEATGG